jgi:sugar phosphate isomerase/epimerase
LGAKIAVVHPIHHMLYKGSEKEIMQLNREYYGSLIAYSKKYNVKIAIENMWQKDPLRGYCVDDVCSKADEFAAFVDEMNQLDNCFVACLDLGHCGLIGEKAEDAIRVLGKDRLKSLHVHDNNYQKDDHTIPGLGKMNWPAISAALSEIGYDGELTLEADKFLFGFDKEFLPTAVRFMHDVAKFWADKV